MLTDERSEFYKRKFSESGLFPQDIKSIEDIQKLPITYKQDLRDSYPFGLFTVPKSQLQRIHCSSGTTGKPTVVGYTKEDVELFSEVVADLLMPQVPDGECNCIMLMATEFYRRIRTALWSGKIGDECSSYFWWNDSKTGRSDYRF